MISDEYLEHGVELIEIIPRLSSIQFVKKD
jgi:hypothetical protein